MAAKTASVNVNIVANAAKAAAGFREAGDAGKAFADSLNKAADKIEADLENTGKIAERLAQELGNNFRTVAGAGVQDLATQINRAGLTMQDLEGNIDGIVSGLRRMESQAEQAADATHGVSAEVDRAGEATHSFAGNAVGDMASAASGIGPLGEAVGQLTERLIAGQVSMKQLGKAGLGMAAIAGVMWAIGRNAQMAAENTADLSKAIHDAARMSDRDLAGTVTAMWVAQQNGFEGMDNAIQDFVTGNLEAARRLADIGESQGLNPQILQELTDAIAAEETALDRADRTQQHYGRSAGNAADSIGNLNDGLDQQKTYLDELDAKWKAYYDAIDQTELMQEVWTSFTDTSLTVQDRLDLIAEYVRTVLQMPPNVMERFQIYISQGDMQAAQDYLWTLQEINRLAAAWRPNQVTTTRTVQPGVSNRILYGDGFATGVVSAPRGMAWVGENGPELINFGGGERVFSSQQSAAMIAGGGNITVNMPAGADGDELVRTLQRWARINGAIPLAVTGTVQR